MLLPLGLERREDVVVATYGDMMRVAGEGGSLGVHSASAEQENDWGYRFVAWSRAPRRACRERNYQYAIFIAMPRLA